MRDADVAAERTAVKVAGRRIAALRTATAHLRSLMEPYLAASQRRLFDQPPAPDRPALSLEYATVILTANGAPQAAGVISLLADLHYLQAARTP